VSAIVPADVALSVAAAEVQRLHDAGLSPRQMLDAVGVAVDPDDDVATADVVAAYAALWRRLPKPPGHGGT
jgi:hypothetical protein